MEIYENSKKTDSVQTILLFITVYLQFIVEKECRSDEDEL